MNGDSRLLPIPLDIVHEMKTQLGGDSILEFVIADYADRCQAAFDLLAIVELTFENVWDVFTAMLPLVYSQ